jgi:NADH dehydrogenase
MQALFVTGSGGFLGRQLVPLLVAGGAQKIFCLSRTQPAAPLAAGTAGNVESIRGTLADALLYERELAQSSHVLHLAAATGRASAGEHFATNVEGTRALVELCKKLGGKKFLHVSTIAVNFPDKRRYFYAQAKEQAESIVRSSGLPFTIVRPTMIFGDSSPVQTALARLAAMPVMPLFGSGETPVQPVDAGDLAAMLAHIIGDDRFAGETLELGGPTALPIRDLLLTMRERLGLPPRVLRLPIGLLVAFLSQAEKVAYDVLPFTVGQLATFRFDGTAEPNSLWQEFRPRMKSLDRMLASLTHAHHPA